MATLNLKDLKLDLVIDNKQPKPDIAICSDCGWRGPVEECLKGQDGDWESGYFEIDECPKCDNGGCIEDYDMTPERLEEYNKWYDRKMKKKRKTKWD